MERLPALSLAAMPGRRNITLDLAVEIEKRGFSGIYAPSMGDSLAFCQALAHVTHTISFGTSIALMLAPKSSLQPNARYF